MWACEWFEGELGTLGAMACMGLVLFPLPTWKRAAVWFSLGWAATLGIGIGLEGPSQDASLPSTVSTWVLVAPRFQTSPSAQSDSGLWRGVWDAMGLDGHRFRVWMAAPDPNVAGRTRWCWVTLRPRQPSDPSDSFPFDSYLESMAVDRVATFHFWDVPHKGLPSLFDSVTHKFQDFQARWQLALREIFGGPGQGLLLGVFAGERKAVPKEVYTAFSHLGLAHLLSVSGYHVGLVAGLFLLLLRFQNRWIRGLSGLGVVLSTAFIAVCGFPVSGVRAWVMVLVGWSSSVRGRRTSLWTAWGVAACVASLHDIHVPRSLGAQLSFLATASLLALEGSHVFWRVPVRAQLSTAWLTLPAFGVVPWAFYPANLLSGLVMLGMGLLAGMGILGIPSCQGAASAWSEAFGRAAVWLDQSWTLWTDSRCCSGELGKVLLLPASLFWVIRMLHGEARRRTVRSSLCGASLLTAGLLVWEQTSQKPLSEALGWWRLRGYPSCTAVEDGFGVCAWCVDESSEIPIRMAKTLGMEGPVRVLSWERSGDSTGKKKWIQPPFQGWTHRKAPLSRSDTLHLE